MSGTKLYFTLNGTNHGTAGEATVRGDFTASPSGPGAIGTGQATLIKSGGGGYTITPMQRVKVARTLSNDHFDRRLVDGIIGHLTTGEWLKTAIKEWVIRVQDVNILGTRIVTSLNPVDGHWPYLLTAGTFAAQVQALVAHIQAAGGGSYEGINATDQVDLANAMPADLLYGGHPLNWYLDHLCETLYRVDGTQAGYFYGVDHTAGATDWGSVVLYMYDLNLLPASTASYAIDPTGLQKPIRGPSYSRAIDATTLYVWRDALYADNRYVGAANSVANTLYPCPWYAPGWGAEPLKLNVTDLDQAQALINADVAVASAPPETVRFNTDAVLHAPGDVIDLTIPLQGLTAAKYRVAATKTVFEQTNPDYPLTEITAGLLPRALGRNRTVGGQPVYRDTIPPDPPTAQPTVVSNVYHPLEHLTYLDVTSINCAVQDIGYLRLRFTVSGADDYTAWIPAPWASPPATYALPQIAVPPGVSVDLAVQGRDLSGNEGAFGPTRTVTSAAHADPPPPTAIVFGADGWDSGGATKAITYTLPSPAQLYTRVVVYPTGSPRAAIINDRISGAVTAYLIRLATRGVNYTVELTSINGGGDESSTPTSATFTAATESPPAPTGLTIDQRGTGGTGGYIKLHWVATSWPDASRYHWTVTLTSGGPVIAQGDVPRIAGSLPTVATLPGLPVNRSLRLLMYTVGAYNDILGPASSPLDFAILTQPTGQPPPIGVTDLTASTDQPAGYVEDSPGVGTTPGWSDTEVLFGKASLVSTLPAASVSHGWLSDPIACEAGVTYQLLVARKGTAAAGAASAAVRWFDKTDSLLSTDTVWSATPTTGWVTIPDTAQTVTAPAGAVYGRLLLKYQGSGAAGSLYWGVDTSKWATTRAQGLDLAPTGTNPLVVWDESASPREQAAKLFYSNPLVELWTQDGSTARGFRFHTQAGGFIMWYPGSDSGISADPGQALGLSSDTAINLGGGGPISLFNALQSNPAATQTSNFTLDASAVLWPVDATAGNVTATLPSAASCAGRFYLIKKIDASANTCIVTRAGSDTIEGATTVTLTTQWDVLVIYSAGGTSWQTWAATVGGGAAATLAFTDLSDVPASYSGAAGQAVLVNGTEDGLTFGPVPPAFPTAGFVIDPATATTYYANFSASFFTTISIRLPSALDWPGTLLTIYLEDPGSGNTITVDSDIGGIGDHIYGSAALGLWAVSSIPLTNQGCTLTLESDGRDSGGGHGAPIAGWWIRDYIA